VCSGNVKVSGNEVRDSGKPDTVQQPSPVHQPPPPPPQLASTAGLDSTGMR
jgi:hypothetical protein